MIVSIALSLKVVHVCSPPERKGMSSVMWVISDKQNEKYFIWEAEFGRNVER
jgi:hypothetical protein